VYEAMLTALEEAAPKGREALPTAAQLLALSDARLQARD
jgi:hypothetical protein